MQNKPNFPNAKMDLTPYGYKDYEDLRPGGPRKNKPNFGPQGGLPMAPVYKAYTRRDDRLYRNLDVSKLGR